WGGHREGGEASGPGGEQNEPNNPGGYPAGLRHHRHSVQKILIDRMALAVDSCLLRHLLFESFALRSGIGELRAAICKLHPASIDLEAFGEPRIGRFRPGERGLDGRIVVKDRRSALSQMRLDLFHENATKNIA